MAEGKKSFIMYADQMHIFKELTDEEAGKLVKHLFAYVNDENPEIEDRLLRIAFEPIKQQLKRDLKDWEGTLEERSTSGRMGNLKRWHPDLHKQVKAGKLDLKEAEKIAKDRKPSHSDDSETGAIANVANVAVNDNDNVNDNSIRVLSKDNTLVSGKPQTSQDQDKELKKQYDDLEKSDYDVYLFIHNHKPKFIDPYIDLWNYFAAKYNKPVIKLVNKNRKTHFKARISEKAFNIIQILSIAGKSSMLKTSGWFTFDWIIKSPNNYVKVMEGNYNDPPAAAAGHQNGEPSAAKQGIMAARLREEQHQNQ